MKIDLNLTKVILFGTDSFPKKDPEEKNYSESAYIKTATFLIESQLINGQTGTNDRGKVLAVELYSLTETGKLFLSEIQNYKKRKLLEKKLSTFGDKLTPETLVAIIKNEIKKA